MAADNSDKGRLSPEQLDAMGVRGRYHSATFDSFDVDGALQADALTACAEWAGGLARGPAGALWILGGVGTGKTHLGVAVAQAIAEDQGATVRVATAREIVREVRETWRPEATERESEILVRYGECDLLVLDDLGHGFNTDAEALQLAEVIDRRYACHRATIVISSLSRHALAHVIGERAHDRLSEGATVVVCDWPSHRTSKRQAHEAE